MARMKCRSSVVAIATAAVFAALIPVAGLQGLQEQEEETPTFILDPIVAVGSRAQPRSVTVSAVPVDVVPVQDFLRQGESDLTNQLRALVPSFNVNTQPISDAASIVRPANLRGLAPDHTLILVNGKRRHRAAVIAWLGNGIADGSQGPDLSVIPAVAIDQVEVLRDGASAQYGSDAIAGVLNFQLKNARSGGSIEVRGGTYLEENTGAAATCGSIGTSCNGIGGRANQYAVSGNVGLPMGETGFANLSFEYGATDPTNRAIQRNDAAGIRSAGNTFVRNTAQVWGSPLVEDDLKLFGNFGTVFSNQLQWYGHTNYHTKTVTGGFYFRNPYTRGSVFSGDSGQTLLVGDVRQANGSGSANCPTVRIINNRPDPAAAARVANDPNCFTFHKPFVGAPNGLPGGFTPQFGGDVFDASVVSGLRGLMFANLNWDLSVNWGRNTVDTFIFDTVNASMGPQSPTSFRPNLLQQTALGFNLDTSYALSEMVNIAAGAEWREEEYHLGAGDPASWEIGPYAEQGFSSGSNGYNGTRPENSGSWARANVALYGDVELRGDDEAWNLGSALRFENFDGFGTTLNGKVSARVALSQVVALRSAVSTGFRAPTPGQQNAFNVTTEYNFEIGDLINKGTIPSTSPAAALRGGTDLEPEKSTNISIGSVVNTGPFIFTADYFRINVSDRLTITKDFSLTPAETQSLIAGGFAEAANLQEFVFFVNDFATVTSGIDLVSTYATELFGGATLFTAVFNFTNTELTDFESETIDEDRRSSLERGIPETRWNFGVSHAADLFTVSSRLSYYGAYWDREDARNWASVTLGDADLSPMYELYSGKALLDLEVGVPLDMGLTLSVGAQNLLNTYPDKHPLAAGGTGNDYGQFGPFGFNGSYYFVRMNYSWGSN